MFCTILLVALQKNVLQKLLFILVFLMISSPDTFLYNFVISLKIRMIFLKP
jgi:hypothetical protein